MRGGGNTFQLTPTVPLKVFSVWSEIGDNRISGGHFSLVVVLLEKRRWRLHEKSENLLPLVVRSLMGIPWSCIVKAASLSVIELVTDLCLLS